MTSARVREILLGQALDPFKADTRHSLALVAFLAWVGLGAGRSIVICVRSGRSLQGTRCSHPLRPVSGTRHRRDRIHHLACLQPESSNCFLTGGGGYRVATSLIGPYAGLTAGAALIVDYVLTIAISVASGVDALFSLLPISLQLYKLPIELVATVLLIFMNLRGAKESIKLLLPVFLGFVATHVVLIVYGIASHASGLPALIPDTLRETRHLAHDTSWVFRRSAVPQGLFTGRWHLHRHRSSVE